MSLLHGRDIISKDKMTLLELHRTASSGEIPVVDPEKKYESITWEELIAPHKKRFLKICELAKQPGKYNLKTGVKIYSKGLNSDSPSKETGNPPIRVAERPRLVRDEQKQERIPDETLLPFLQDEFKQTRVPAAQFDEIQKGWGAAQEKRIVLDACYREEEIEQIADLPKGELIAGKNEEEFKKVVLFCTGLLLPFIDDIEEISFTRDDIIQKAKEFDIGTRTAHKIHLEMNPTIKGKQGRPKSKKPAQ